MRNTFLDNRSALDIEVSIDRLHKEMGLTTGRVELEVVRDRLKIDRKYYSTNDPGLLQEAVHKLRMGAAQVFQRPTLLAEAILKFDLKALYLPDRKRILIDENLPDLKKRWNEAHEIAHSLIPWHTDYMHGDNSETLSPACHAQIEAEANYGAGRLLAESDPSRYTILIEAGTAFWRKPVHRSD
jgi:hypothetical protein